MESYSNANELHHLIGVAYNLMWFPAKEAGLIKEVPKTIRDLAERLLFSEINIPWEVTFSRDCFQINNGNIKENLSSLNLTRDWGMIEKFFEDEGYLLSEKKISSSGEVISLTFSLEI